DSTVLRILILFAACRAGNVASSSSSAFHTSAVLSKVSEARQERSTNGGRAIWAGSSSTSRCLHNRPRRRFQPEYGVADMPKYKAFGVAEAEAKTLFRRLPDLTIDSPGREEKAQKEVEAAERLKAVNFARVIDLRNADVAGISYENRRRIIVAFSTPENPFDPGRTEVQAAILTYRIRKLYAHLTRCKHDLQNKLSLRKLVHQRAKILKYLKRTARVRYDALLQDLCVEPDAVEGELIVK
ncbi:mitochondrial ribosomal protein S15, partial [Mycena olivaceomarginata]